MKETKVTTQNGKDSKVFMILSDTKGKELYRTSYQADFYPSKYVAEERIYQFKLAEGYEPDGNGGYYNSTDREVA